MKTLFKQAVALACIAIIGATSMADGPVYQSQSVFPVTANNQRKIIGSSSQGSDLWQAFQGFLDNSSMWKSQEALTTAMFDLVTDLSVDFQVFDGIKFEFRPQRQIYFVNEPLARDGTISDGATSHYLVMNNLISRIKGEVNIVDNLKVTGETGFSFRVVRNQETVTHLPPSTEIDLSSESESTFGLSAEQTQNLEAKKHFHFFAFLGKVATQVYDGLESIIQKTASPFIDDEASQILFAKLFDPGREPFALPLSADYVDTKLAEGEVASFTAFSGTGPVLGGGEVVTTSISNQIRLAYQTAVKKEANGFAVLRSQIAVRKGVEWEPIRVRIGLGLGPITVGYNLTRWQIESAHHHIIERTFRYDLKVPEARQAFNEALHGKFATTDKNLKVATWAEPVYSGTIDRSIYRNQFKANLGFLRANNNTWRNVDTELASDGDTRYSGQSILDSYFYIKLFKLQRESARHNNMQIGSLEGAKADWSVQNQIFLGNESTTNTEYKKMLQLIQYALGPDAPPIPPRLSERLIAEKTQQKIETRILLSPSVISAALKTTPLQFWNLLGKVFMDDETIWSSPGNRAKFEQGLRDHASIRPNPVIFDRARVALRAYYMTALYLGTSYEKVFKTEKPVKKLEILTKVHSKLGVSGLFNYLFLTMSKLQGGPSIPYYSIRFSGEGLKSPLTVYNQNDSTLISNRPNQPIGDLDNLTNSERRIIEPVVFLNKNSPSQVHLRFDSLMKATKGQRLALWIAEQKMLKDIPVAGSVVENLIPENQDSQSDGADYYAYEVALSEKIPLDKKKEYVLHYRFENARGEPLSEFEEIWFKLPN